jgi:CheY-like chemotaxis protein
MIDSIPFAKEQYSAFVVDDDPVILKLIDYCLSRDGFAVTTARSGEEALERIMNWRPDCVVLDIMMPGMDGLELCRRLRETPQLATTKIIVISGKTYQSDRHNAIALGADAFINKPFDVKSFSNQVRRIIEDRIHLTFWGIRGTLPVPGPKSVRFGGNTSCVSIEFSRGPLLVFDAGTGIKVLSDHLATRKPGLEVKIFISHPHWDHINALPFFAPLYIRGNSIEILGPCQRHTCVEDYIRGQMDGVYFPITAQEFGARVIYTNLREEVLEIEQRIKVRTMLLNHPGHCLGYRVEYQDYAICYITDNELYPENSGLRDQGYISKLEAFVQGATVLIADTTYTDSEYLAHINWGHSPVSEVVDLAHRANVKTLYIFHHDPSQDDASIDYKLKEACSQLEQLNSTTKCLAPIEGQLVII